ncbi:MAG: DUF2183 domain-containing protein [Bacteroidales bacterium]|nr:DUF2183 domain-containing protein [Bacteroidales bacterium]
MRFLFVMVFVVLVRFAFGQSYNNFIVISDIDDTYKITNTTSGFTAFTNAMFSTRVFAGSTEMYNLMKQEGARLYFVSNTPTIIAWRVKKLIRENGVRCDGYFLRTAGEPGIKHKIETIRSIVDSCPGTRLILIGDNSENDELVYDSIAGLYPGRVAAVYIRPVKDLPRICTQYVYFSAVDIAFYECENERLNETQVEKVFDAVQAADMLQIVPGFIPVNEKILLNEVAGCFYPHCLFKNKTLERVLDVYKHR